MRRHFALLVLCDAALAACDSLQIEPQASVPPASDIRRVNPQQAERLYAIMVPLLKGMDKPLSAKQVHVGIIEDRSPAATGAVAEDRPCEALFECIAQAYPLPDAALPLLASRRAEAISAYLVEHGVPEERVRTGRLQAVKVAGEGGVYAALAVEPAAAAQPLARAAETAQGARRD